MPKLETPADQQYQHQLPKVSFRVVTDDKTLLQPAGVHSEQSRSYGYNDFSDFERPDYYIRHIEPIEAELAVQVEYDMDEQDQAWLDAINAERKKDQSGAISYEAFEIIMDKLEKEWFNLIKRIPQPASHAPVEDSKCAVCDDSEGENSNAIVFCDGCNLAVHQDCYGVPYIPEGQWLCRKCTVSPENPVSCLFCPNEGGAFKQTTTGHWAHLLCAIWIPELVVGNPIYMEPVDGVESIPKNRWKLTCSLCREKVGACIQCADRSCFVAFHVTCARQHGLLMSMKSLNTDGVLKAYCDKHLPYDAHRVEDEDDVDSSYTENGGSRRARPKPSQKRAASQPRVTSVTTKSARAHAKSYRPGPPIVPRMIVNKLEEYVARIAIRKRHPFIERLCRYWSLKREARRGAPLLKRLHLEPWTASSASRQQSEAEKALKLKFLQKLRTDLDTVRTLSESVRKREKEKLRQAQSIKDVIDSFIFPFYGKLRMTLDKISAMDRTDLFLRPVNVAEVPDYLDVVSEPMCWLDIDDKLEQNAYLNVDEFRRDVGLVLDNAMLYNANDNPFHRTAKRIKANSKPLLDELDTLKTQSRYLFRSESDDDDHELPSLPFGAVGDLEPSQMLLECLLQPAAGMPNQDWLSSVFSFALERPKDPTPPPAPRPSKNRKSMSAAEKRQRWEEREAKYQERVAGRSTRATEAKEKAFTEDSGVQDPTPDEDEQSVQAGPSRRRSIRVQPIESRTTEPSEDGPSTGPVSSTSSMRPQSRQQRGVAGIETIAVLNDRERREQERQLELMTPDIDSQDLFKRFNIGWVLPEGSKRRRAERPPSPPRPAPQRQSKTAKSQSVEVKSEIVQPPPAFRSSLTPPQSSELSEDFTPQTSPVKTRTALLNAATKKRKADEDQQSAGTPRQSKRIRRLEGDDPDDARSETPRPRTRTQIVAEAQPSSTPISSAPSSAVVRRTDKDATPLATSARSSPNKPKGKPTSRLESSKQEAAAEEARDEEFPTGVLVWAKMTSYPYFPGLVMDPVEDEKQIPNAVKALRPKGEKVWLVRFFDSQSSFGWIPRNRLDLLGALDEIDEWHLACRDKSSKSGRMKKTVREAYKLALASRESSGEDP